MNLSIRLGTVDDAELIADISRQSFYETFAGANTKENMDKFLTEQFTKGRLMLEVGRPENIFLLAFADRQVAGYVKLREDKKKTIPGKSEGMEIARLYAMKEYVGKGIGKALMQESIAIARQQGKEVIWLCVWEHNQPAIQFYRSWGFEVFGEQDFLLGNDLQRDWMMKKELT